MASRDGYLEMVKYLVSIGADIRSEDNEALREASSNGHLEIVDYLVSIGADIRSRNNETVKRAFENGHLEVVRYLISQGASRFPPSSKRSRSSSPPGGRAKSPRRALLNPPVNPLLKNIDRSMCPAYDIDFVPCPEDDAKIFKNKLLRLHPDKNLGCHNYANEAFKYYTGECRKN